MFIPQLVIALFILIVGWIVGWLVERVLISVFRALPFFDEVLRNVGLEEVTKRAGMRINLGKFFGVVLKVFIIFAFLVAAIDVLGLQAVNQFLISEVLGYLPKVISAAFVVVIGLVVANFVSNMVAGASRAVKVEGGIATKITKWSIVVLSVIVALGELGIANEIMQSVVVGIIASISLALGLAFGLGGQQAAADFINRVKDDIGRG
ncbi:MAG: hypothetical protein OYG31_01190 [Candidatus Kaiserbacteria bacterium]|nr:hypothetical protein [Candidatus Kaiserbacteria bacterium]